MSRYRSIALKLLGSALLALLIVGLEVACETTSANLSAHTPTVTPFASFVPKGPGSAALTATARATPSPLICPAIHTGAAASTSGWPTYTDTRFPFHFSYPEGWRAGSTKSSSADGANTSYIVQIFPPTSNASFDWHSSVFDREHFEISIILTGPSFSLANDPSYSPEPQPVALGQTQVTFYGLIRK